MSWREKLENKTHLSFLKMILGRKQHFEKDFVYLHEAAFTKGFYKHTQRIGSRFEKYERRSLVGFK